MQVFGLLWTLSCIGHGHLTWGSEIFDIYVVVEEESKEDVFQELTEKYYTVEEQLFFLPNKALLVARSKKKTTGFRSKSFQSVEEEITEDVNIFRQRPNVFLSNKVHLLERHVRSFRTNDTQWPNMWQINGDVSPTMKVVEAWQTGYNGRGIIVSVVDEGLETGHSDLDANVRLDGHYDFVDSDSNPNPPFNFQHGTQVAGFIAAERDNDNCIVGVAYSSTLIGLRLISNNYTTDINEAQAIAHGYNITDISSNSWGPPESYGYFAPGALTLAAFELGVTQGRGGKGVIYVWAAGNGETTDNCNADGYANSIYTVTISSVNSNGQPAWYSEVCAPALAVTYSGDKYQRNMFTTSNADLCSGGIEGTSFSAPQAAGMVALALQANPNLTWRDVQHLIVKTAKYQNLKEGDGYGFTLNGAGNYVGQMFGYGLMDAEAMVRYSKTWKTVPQQEIFNSSISSPYWVLNSASTTKSASRFVSSTCTINYLEHVQVHTIFQSSERAYVELELVSPSGTLSKLMTQRRYDKGFSGQQEWTFMSVQFWGENPRGNWTFTIKIPFNQTGNLTSWQLILYGTSADPLSGIPICDESPCKNGGTCTSSSKYDISNCTCAPGYSGNNCETDINECQSDPCKDGATCMDLVNAYNCTCRAGYVYNSTTSPEQCQDINECIRSPCRGISTCENRPGCYECVCPIGYIYNQTASDCTDQDECKPSRCSPDRECINTIGSYICNCTSEQGCNNTAASDSSGLSPAAITGIVVGVSCVLLAVSAVVLVKMKQRKISPLSRDVINSRKPDCGCCGCFAGTLCCRASKDEAKQRTIPPLSRDEINSRKPDCGCCGCFAGSLCCRASEDEAKQRTISPLSRDEIHSRKPDCGCCGCFAGSFCCSASKDEAKQRTISPLSRDEIHSRKPDCGCCGCFAGSFCCRASKDEAKQRKISPLPRNVINLRQPTLDTDSTLKENTDEYKGGLQTNHSSTNADLSHTTPTVQTESLTHNQN